MTRQPSNARLESLWQQLVDAEYRFYAARMALYREATAEDGLVGLLRTPLAQVGQRGTALRLLADLANNEHLQRELFPELVEVASATHADIALVRKIILSLDREWVAEHLPQQIENVLRRLNGDDAAEAYSRLAELLDELHSPYLAVLTQKAAASEDPVVRAVSGYLSSSGS